MEKKQKSFPMGIIIFGGIIIYLVISLARYMMSPHTNTYEVRPGRLTPNTAYSGVIIREEELYSADKTGYLSFYCSDGNKVRKGSPLFSYSTDKDSGDSAELELNNTARIRLENEIGEFQKEYSDEDFGRAYDFLYQIKSKTLNYRASDVMKAGAGVVRAPRDGIIVFARDGLEDLTPEQVTEDLLNRKEYTRQDMRESGYAESGSPVYKLLTSENWSVCIHLDDEMYEYLSSQEIEVINTRVEKDNARLRAGLTLYDINGMHFARLDYDNSMVRYAGDRFLNISLMVDTESGLKIPQSAITEKTCYLIPDHMLYTDAVTEESGVYLKSSGTDIVFSPVNVYRTDEETGLCTCAGKELAQGAVICTEDKSAEYTLNDTTGLRGVYNVNKGYATFKQIEELYSNEEYCIVRENTAYGLSNYDYIAKDASGVTEDTLVY